MIRLLSRCDESAIFDCSRWPMREALVRVGAVLGGTAFLARRIALLPGFPGLTHDSPWLAAGLVRLSCAYPRLSTQPFFLDDYYGQFGYTPAGIRLIWGLRALIWVLESGIMLGCVAGWLTRIEARSPAKGFMQTAFPLLIAGLPLVITATEYSIDGWFPASSGHALMHTAILVLIAGGGLFTVAGLCALRRAFSIMSEARALVRSGLFRYVRHPLYAGYFLSTLGYTLLHLHPGTVALYLAFVAGQTLRARIEERKLLEVFPDYEGYRARTGMFFPRLTRP